MNSWKKKGSYQEIRSAMAVCSLTQPDFLAIDSKAEAI